MFRYFSFCFLCRYRLNSASDDDEDGSVPIYDDYEEYMQFREGLQEFPGRIPPRKKKEANQTKTQPRKSRVSLFFISFAYVLENVIDFNRMTRQFSFSWLTDLFMRLFSIRFSFCGREISFLFRRIETIDAKRIRPIAQVWLFHLFVTHALHSINNICYWRWHAINSINARSFVQFRCRVKTIFKYDIESKTKNKKK